jgi:hypothetical protein
LLVFSYPSKEESAVDDDRHDRDKQDAETTARPVVWVVLVPMGGFAFGVAHHAAAA